MKKLTTEERILTRWATKQLAGDMCLCEDCKAARAILASIKRAHK